MGTQTPPVVWSSRSYHLMSFSVNSSGISGTITFRLGSRVLASRSSTAIVNVAQSSPVSRLPHHPSLALYHCHTTPETPPSPSPSIALLSASRPRVAASRGLSSPGSCVFLTLTVTSFLAMLTELSVATTVTLYTLFPPASIGDSKLG